VASSACEIPCSPPYGVSDGLPGEVNGPLHPDKRRANLVAPVHGGLYWLKEGAVERFREAGLDKDVVIPSRAAMEISGRETTRGTYSLSRTSQANGKPLPIPRLTAWGRTASILFGSAAMAPFGPELSVLA